MITTPAPCPLCMPPPPASGTHTSTYLSCHQPECDAEDAPGHGVGQVVVWVGGELEQVIDVFRQRERGLGLEHARGACLVKRVPLPILLRSRVVRDDLQQG